MLDDFAPIETSLCWSRLQVTCAHSGEQDGAHLIALLDRRSIGGYKDVKGRIMCIVGSNVFRSIVVVHDILPAQQKLYH